MSDARDTRLLQAATPGTPAALVTDALVTETVAARALAISTSSMARLRRSGNGPPVVKMGRLIRYERASLTQWIQDQLGLEGGAAAPHPAGDDWR